jgi:2-dehydro-3-deoxyphosphogluconate aldolase/(4S)-4-hydroxy-2-oxoglutarate aldolase
MYKFNILRRILQDRIVAIIPFDNADTAFKTSEACIEGGASVLEISFTTPDALDIIKTLNKRHANRALIDAGTVLVSPW